MSRKPDTISYREFNKLTDHTDTHHSTVPSQVLFDDENINQLEETLMGMEYDSEDLAEVADDDDDVDLELSAEDELEEDEEDLLADRDDELDESAI